MFLRSRQLWRVTVLWVPSGYNAPRLFSWFGFHLPLDVCTPSRLPHFPQRPAPSDILRRDGGDDTPDAPRPALARLGAVLQALREHSAAGPTDPEEAPAARWGTVEAIMYGKVSEL